ncbi:hypothetical protein DFJ74DRAFT_746546 [Hyaloraphidium curvatum]|nr:hypothetical protein DFJ74DRAFT_746546 [Hyaloraphidium curvatum]
MAASQESTIQRIEQFCEEKRIPTDGILAMTVQRNRMTSFFSIIVDFAGGKLLPLYPAEALSRYSEIVVPDDKRGPDFLVCYLAGLAPIPNQPPVEANTMAYEHPPFCCRSIAPYKPRPLHTEQPFRDLAAGSGGHHPTLVFEVKRQVDDGPLVSTRYYQLIGVGLVERTDGPFVDKAHAFKNYKCSRYGLFFGVDLFRAPEAAARANYHHMRLNPFEHRNAAVEDECFVAAGV